MLSNVPTGCNRPCRAYIRPKCGSACKARSRYLKRLYRPVWRVLLPNVVRTVLPNVVNTFARRGAYLCPTWRIPLPTLASSAHRGIYFGRWRFVFRRTRRVYCLPRLNVTIRPYPACRDLRSFSRHYVLVRTRLNGQCCLVRHSTTFSQIYYRRCTPSNSTNVA